MTDQDSLKLDPNPSPAEEAKDFETADEKAAARENAHELAVISANQGRLGAFLGTTDTNLKIAFVVICISGSAFLGSLVGFIWKPEFADLAQISGTFMMTAVGYVFGKLK